MPFEMGILFIVGIFVIPVLIQIIANMLERRDKRKR